MEDCFSYSLCLRVSYGCHYKVRVLVIVGKWGIRVMLGCGTRSRLQVHGCFKRVAVAYRLGSMLCLICVLRFPILFGDVSDCEQLFNGIGEVFEVDGTMRVE